ncbi:MAG TPA: DUF3048 domain-containing protein [Candidatus Saccharimonadales bacterium]|nr:DUF3048 domain-containing protein [Candidatus Saccharimonadales bacterium]
MKDITKLKSLKRKEPKADLNFTIDEDDNLEQTSENQILSTKPTKFHRFKGLKLTKIHYLISGAVILIVVVIAAFLLTSKPTASPAVKVIKKPIIVKPIIYYSSLSGLPVTKAESQLPVTGIMIENSDEARPQSGLSQAGVVFEALAEGGITRFLALFQEGQPNSIGPIRSARPYFIDWALGFDASYVHVGGSPDALTQIQTDNVKDINEFYYGNDFTRITSRDAPHNVYTSMSTLLSLETTLGYNNSKFTGFPRKVDQPAKVPTATNINFSLSSSDYAVNYLYDKTSNSYLRSEGGATMVDANTNLELNPKVVIAIVVPWTNGILDASGAYYTDYADIGSGDAFIFQDGTVVKGVWTKTTPTSQITFTTTSGGVINLNAGQTWITAVGDDSGVSYQ